MAECLGSDSIRVSEEAGKVTAKDKVIALYPSARFSNNNVRLDRMPGVEIYMAAPFNFASDPDYEDRCWEFAWETISQWMIDKLER